jgi:hypothetical protein
MLFYFIFSINIFFSIRQTKLVNQMTTSFSLNTRMRYGIDGQK